MSFVSESLIFGGVYAGTHQNPVIGLTLICLGILGGISSFLYHVSLSQNEETRKTMIYAEIKRFFDFFAKTIHAVGIDESKNKNPTIH